MRLVLFAMVIFNTGLACDVSKLAQQKLAIKAILEKANGMSDSSVNEIRKLEFMGKNSIRLVYFTEQRQLKNMYSAYKLDAQCKVEFGTLSF